MRCEDVESRLIDYYHGELETKERLSVAGHLSDCGGCASEYCRLDADLKGITEVMDVAPDPSVRRKLRAEVAREFRVPWWRQLFRAAKLPIPAYQTIGFVGLALAIAITALPGPKVNSSLSTRSPAIESTAVPSPTAKPSTLLNDYDANGILSVANTTF